jgi:hypothetical protein
MLSLRLHGDNATLDQAPHHRLAAETRHLRRRAAELPVGSDAAAAAASEADARLRSLSSATFTAVHHGVRGPRAVQYSAQAASTPRSGAQWTYHRQLSYGPPKVGVPSLTYSNIRSSIEYHHTVEFEPASESATAWPARGATVSGDVVDSTGRSLASSIDSSTMTVDSTEGPGALMSGRLHEVTARGRALLHGPQSSRASSSGTLHRSRMFDGPPMLDHGGEMEEEASLLWTGRVACATEGVVAALTAKVGSLSSSPAWTTACGRAGPLDCVSHALETWTAVPPSRRASDTETFSLSATAGPAGVPTQVDGRRGARATAGLWSSWQLQARHASHVDAQHNPVGVWATATAERLARRMAGVPVDTGLGSAGRALQVQAAVAAPACSPTGPVGAFMQDMVPALTCLDAPSADRLQCHLDLVKLVGGHPVVEDAMACILHRPAAADSLLPRLLQLRLLEVGSLMYGGATLAAYFYNASATAGGYRDTTVLQTLAAVRSMRRPTADMVDAVCGLLPRYVADLQAHVGARDLASDPATQLVFVAASGLVGRLAADMPDPGADLVDWTQRRTAIAGCEVTIRNLVHWATAHDAAMEAVRANVSAAAQTAWDALPSSRQRLLTILGAPECGLPHHPSVLTAGTPAAATVEARVVALRAQQALEEFNAQHPDAVAQLTSLKLVVGVVGGAALSSLLPFLDSMASHGDLRVRVAAVAALQKYPPALSSPSFIRLLEAPPAFDDLPTASLDLRVRLRVLGAVRQQAAPTGPTLQHLVDLLEPLSGTLGTREYHCARRCDGLCGDGLPAGVSSALVHPCRDRCRRACGQVLQYSRAVADVLRVHGAILPDHHRRLFDIPDLPSFDVSVGDQSSQSHTFGSSDVRVDLSTTFDNSASLSASLTGVEFGAVTKDSVTAQGTMFGRSLSFLYADVDVELAGALSVDLSGVAKVFARAGDAVMEVLNAVQFAIDVALQLLDEVTGALDALEAYVTNGLFADGINLTSTILTAIHTLQDLVTNSRQYVEAGTGAVDGADALYAVQDSAYELEAAITLLGNPVVGMSGVLQGVQTASAALGTDLGGLLTTLTSARTTVSGVLAAVPATWSSALASVHDVGVTVEALSGAIAASPLLPPPGPGTALPPLPALPALNATVVTAAGTALAQTIAVVQGALSARASGLLSDTEWVVSVAGSLPTVLTAREAAQDALSAFTSLNNLGPVVASVSSALDTSTAALCGQDVARLRSAVQLVQQYVGNLGVGTSGAAATASATLTAVSSMQAALPQLTAAGAAGVSASAGAGPVFSAFQSNVSTLAANASLFTAVSTAAAALSTGALVDVPGLTNPVKIATTVFAPFIAIVASLTGDSSDLQSTLEGLSSSVGTLHMQVDQFTSPVGTVVAVMSRVLDIVNRFPTFRDISQPLQSGVGLVQEILNDIELPFTYAQQFLKYSLEVLSELQAAQGANGTLAALVNGGLQVNDAIANITGAASTLAAFTSTSTVLEQVANLSSNFYPLGSMQAAAGNVSAAVGQLGANAPAVAAALSLLTSAVTYVNAATSVEFQAALASLLGELDTGGMCQSLRTASTSLSGLTYSSVAINSTDPLPDALVLQGLLADTTGVCVSCVQASLTALLAEARSASSALVSAQSLVAGVGVVTAANSTAALAQATAANISTALNARSAFPLGPVPCGPSDIASVGALFCTWSGVLPTLAAVGGSISTTAGAVQGLSTSAQAALGIISSLTAPNNVVDTLHTLEGSLGTLYDYSLANAAFQDPNFQTVFLQFMVLIPEGAATGVFEVVGGGVQVLHDILVNVNSTLTSVVVPVIAEVKSGVSWVRAQVASLAVSDPVPAAANDTLITCKDPTNPTVPPCLHPVPRGDSIIQAAAFGLNYLLLWVFTDFAKYTWPVPGMFNGYVLQGVTWATYGGGAAEYTLSVYNPDPSYFGQGAPALGPVIAVHDATDGTLLRVMELYDTNGAPLAMSATGIAVTPDTMVVAAINGSNGVLVGFAIGPVTQSYAPGFANTPSGVLSASGVTVSVGPLQLNGVSMGVDSTGTCSLTLSTPTGAYAVPLTAPCAWPPSGTITPGNLNVASNNSDIASAVAFIDGTTNLPYLAVLRCIIVKGYDCSVQFYNASNTAAPVYSLLVPSSATGLAYDAGSHSIVLGFNGGATSKIGLMRTAGRLVEDRIMVFAVPVLQTIFPRRCKPATDSRSGCALARCRIGVTNVLNGL